MTEDKNTDGTKPNKVVEASFLQFVSGMAAQTLIHLGMMSNPVSNQRGVDLINAKYSIDLLGIIEEKTKGNLTEEEEHYLSNALKDLRMHYVKLTETLDGDGQNAEKNG